MRCHKRGLLRSSLVEEMAAGGDHVAGLVIKNSPRLGVFEIEDVEDGIGHEDQAFSSRGNFHCHVTRGMAGRGDCRHTRKETAGLRQKIELFLNGRQILAR